jgi:hypothetical protein
MYLSLIGFLCITVYNIDCNRHRFYIYLFYAFKYIFPEQGSLGFTRLSKRSTARQEFRIAAADRIGKLAFVKALR